MLRAFPGFEERSVRYVSGRRLARWLGRKLACRVKATDDDDRSDKALSTLDSLLGSARESDGPPPHDGRDPALVEWWRIRPRQAAPPRTTSISSAANPAGRFIANEEMLRNEVWAGRKTLPGQALELPKVVPYGSYVLALINTAVYGTLVRVYATQGADAAADLLGGLGLSRAPVVEQAELWRLLSGCFIQPDLASLVVVLYGMLVVAPRVEACLGYRTFGAVCVLSAVVAADVLIALSSPAFIPADTASTGDAAIAAVQAASTGMLSSDLLDAMTLSGSLALVGLGPWLLCGGLGLAMGLAGSSLAHQIVNGDVERQASGGAASSSGRGGSTGAAAGEEGVAVGGGAALGMVEGRTAVLLAGVGAVSLHHMLEMGGSVALVAALGTGLGTGFLLSSTAGPRYQVTREVELPDGSMWIPDPEAVHEVTVVLDQTPSIQRTLATTAVTSVVMIGTIALISGGS